MYYQLGKIVERYGEPILRFKPHGKFTKDELLDGDIPDEVIVVRIPHLSEYMVYVHVIGDQWYPNHGERWVIRELLRRLNETQK